MLDVTDATFETEVLEASDTQPVIVDLWAPWCGPCRQLGPILDAAINATSGAVKGVKANVDENPAVSQAFSVQSIPAVYALRNRAVVDGFVGARGQADVEEFLARVQRDHGATDADAGASDGDAVDGEPVSGGAVDGELVDSTADSGETEPRPEVPDDVENQLESLLATVKLDDEARERFLELLDVMGPDDPRTGPWRRRLTTALF